ncbi:hypothetical protein PO909_033679 [Leuciscus waleckii]
MSRQRHPSGTHHSSRLDVLDKQERELSWQNPGNIQRMKNTEQNKYVLSRIALGKIFPLKPVLHKRAFSLSNVTRSQHQEILNMCLPTLNDQAAVRQQQKTVRKLDPISSSHLTGRKKLDQEEKQTGLSKEEDEDEDEDVRKPNTRDSTRRDRSHLKHERENKEGFDQLKEKRLQRVELTPEEYPDAPHQLIPCNVCGRCFAPDWLETHMRVCEKKRPERKVFNTFWNRIKGTALEKFMETNVRSKTQEVRRTITTYVTLDHVKTETNQTRAAPGGPRHGDTRDSRSDLPSDDICTMH